MTMRTIAMLLLALMMGAEQQVNLEPAMSRLAQKAQNKIEVSLDSSMLNLASAFLSDSDRDQAAAKKVLAGLKGVYVRVFKFDGPNEYSQADIDPIRSQLRGPDWNQIVATSGGHNATAGVWVRQENGAAAGIVVIATEEDEVTVVNLVGTIRPEDLAALGGEFGIPKVTIK
jgi:hypothetical protein